ncbi:hypothetical protein PACTADRAFT_4409 [Pachysolen tannophilus NRRL Y-2460]|uniref:Spindle pole body component Bbp1 C-terminal domain-containing protein n=1 Tax=Pachysolen tannophilus NRRL Y-2460 TaxID=669874 RepID=A0A1E4TRV1_PACTA|nr:hypothetical protein PACTADRAFT_4409 [Pachysolen tannophilus NRRL Y-2460]
MNEGYNDSVKMFWSNNQNDDLTINTLNQSTINSFSDDQLIPPTPSYKNGLFSRAFNTIFGSSGVSSKKSKNLDDGIQFPYNDYENDENQSVRRFFTNNGPRKSVNWGSRSPSSDSMYDSDDEINETIKSITLTDYGKNNFNNKLPGTFPEFKSKNDNNNNNSNGNFLNEIEVLKNCIVQTRETNNVLKQLFEQQHFEMINDREQVKLYSNLKKNYANELYNSKKIYEAFLQIIQKYKNLKKQLKEIEIENHENDLKNEDQLKQELDKTKRIMLSKSRRLEEAENNLKKMISQRDDLKTTILEYKNQNLRLKTSNNGLLSENSKLSEKSIFLQNELQKIKSSKNNLDNNTIVFEKKKLSSKIERLEFQINDIKNTSKIEIQNLKEKIFDLNLENEKLKEFYESELSRKDKYIPTSRSRSNNKKNNDDDSILALAKKYSTINTDDEKQKDFNKWVPKPKIEINNSSYRPSARTNIQTDFGKENSYELTNTFNIKDERKRRPYSIQSINDLKQKSTNYSRSPLRGLNNNRNDYYNKRNDIKDFDRTDYSLPDLSYDAGKADNDLTGFNSDLKNIFSSSPIKRY